MTMISIQGLDKAKLLAALWNAASPSGVSYTPSMMKREEAVLVLNKYGNIFTVLDGRKLWINLSGPQMSTEWYDKHNGHELSSWIVDYLRMGGTENSPKILERSRRLHLPPILKMA